MKRLELFPEISEKIFLKIGILSAKVYTNKVPNIQVGDLTTVPPTNQSVKVVIVVAKYYYV